MLKSFTEKLQQIQDKVKELVKAKGAPFSVKECGHIIDRLIKDDCGMNDEAEAFDSRLFIQDIEWEMKKEAEQIKALQPKLNYYVLMPRKTVNKVLEDGLNKEEIYHLLDLHSEAKSGIIQDFKLYHIEKVMKVKCGERYSAASTRYIVHKRLYDKGYFKIQNSTLTLSFYDEAFKTRGEGTVILPAFILSESFKNAVSVAGLRLALFLCARIGGISRHKVIGFNMPEVLKILKRRVPGEVQKPIDEISTYFNIKETSHLKYQASYKEAFIVKDMESLKGEAQPVAVVNRRKWDAVRSAAKEYDILTLLKERENRCRDKAEFKEVDAGEAFNKVAAIVRHLSLGQIHRILHALSRKLRNYTDLPRSIGAFVQDLVNRYILGQTYIEKRIKKLKQVIEGFMEIGCPRDCIPEHVLMEYEHFMTLHEREAARA